MAKNEVVTVHLKPDVREKLDALARDTNRSASHLASEAIEAYVNLHAWQVEHIKAALTEDEAGGPAVPHEEVVQWLQSWGRDRELPRPSRRNLEFVWRSFGGHPRSTISKPFANSLHKTIGPRQHVS